MWFSNFALKVIPDFARVDDPVILPLPISPFFIIEPEFNLFLHPLNSNEITAPFIFLWYPAWPDFL